MTAGVYLHTYCLVLKASLLTQVFFEFAYKWRQRFILWAISWHHVYYWLADVYNGPQMIFGVLFILSTFIPITAKQFVTSETRTRVVEIKASTLTTKPTVLCANLSHGKTSFAKLAFSWRAITVKIVPIVLHIFKSNCFTRYVQNGKWT